jgi:hypothetical protein
MTKARTNTDRLWGQPEDLRQLGVMHTNWLVRRIEDRPGGIQGHGPIDVIGAAADFANRGMTRRIMPTLLLANAAGWVIRDWAVPYQWVTGNQHVNVHQTFPAVFGYCDQDTASRLAAFSVRYGYNCTNRPLATTTHRLPGPPHVYVGGHVAVRSCIGWQRNTADIAEEWPGCNPVMLATLGRARQFTLWSEERTLWSDLAQHYRAHYTEVSP